MWSRVSSRNPLLGPAFRELIWELPSLSKAIAIIVNRLGYKGLVTESFLGWQL